MLLSLVASCSLKEAIENGHQTEIAPLAPSDTLAERFGNKRVIRVPLAESSLGYVDIDEIVAQIIGKEKLDRDSKNFIERLRDGFVMSLGRLAMGAGLFNKFKVSSYNNFEYLDQSVITSVKVKRVFFTTENCRIGEKDCDNAKNEKTNLTFIDKLFVNLSNYEDAPGTPEELLLENIEGEGVESLSNKKFKAAVRKSFSQTDVEVQNKMKTFNKGRDSMGILRGDENSINLVKFTNTVPVMNLKFVGVSPTDRKLHLDIAEKHQQNAVASYLKAKSLKHLVKRASKTRDGVNVELRRDVTPKMLTDKISSDQSPTVANMIIFRLNSRFKEAEAYFKAEAFAGIVKETSIIGKSVYVELTDASMKPLFNQIIDAENDYRSTDLDIYSVDSCLYANCVDVAVKDFNLLPVIVANPKVKIDTFFSVKTLGGVDFKYNGFIEIELELDLPF